MREKIEESTVTTMADTAELWQTLIPAMPDYVPLEPDFQPPNPTKVFRVGNIGTSALSRRIYLDMRRAIQTYSQLILLAPSQDIQTIVSLRSQMNLLSISMLSIYQTLSNSQNVPRLISWWTPVPKNYVYALQTTYNRVFSIYLQCLNLFNQTAGTSITPSLLIIINNLKSQLKIIQSLQTAQKF